MEISLTTATLLLTLVLQAAPGRPAPARPADPVTDVAREMFAEHRKNIAGAFAAMPEEKYGFKPTPELMTFGELAIHIAGAHVYYCGRLGAPAPTFSRPKGTVSKAELTRYLEQTLTYCEPVVIAARDGSLGDLTQAGATGIARTRAFVLLSLVSGMDHHYGQAAGYLRLNNIVPPTAQPVKQ